MRRESITLALDHAAPTEIAFEILGRDAIEGTHPAFQPAGVGADVLNVLDALDDMLAVRGDHGLVLDADLLGETPIGLGAVGDEQGVGRHHRPQALRRREGHTAS